MADAELAALLVDADGALGSAVLEAGPGDLVLAPMTLEDADGDPRALVRWEIRASVLVGAAIDRLLDPDTPVARTFGFGDEVFVVELDDRLPAAAVDAYLAVVEELAAGTRDPLEPVAVPTPDETEDPPDDDEVEP